MKWSGRCKQAGCLAVRTWCPPHQGSPGSTIGLQLNHPATTGPKRPPSYLNHLSFLDPPARFPKHWAFISRRVCGCVCACHLHVYTLKETPGMKNNKMHELWSDRSESGCTARVCIWIRSRATHASSPDLACEGWIWFIRLFIKKKKKKGKKNLIWAT